MCEAANCNTLKLTGCHPETRSNELAHSRLVAIPKGKLDHLQGVGFKYVWNFHPKSLGKMFTGFDSYFSKRGGSTSNYRQTIAPGNDDSQDQNLLLLGVYVGVQDQLDGGFVHLYVVLPFALNLFNQQN